MVQLLWKINERNAVNAVKINISPLFTAFFTKYNRKIHRISYKYATHQLLRQIKVRNAVKAVSAASAVNKNFSPHFTAFLTKIHQEIHCSSYQNSPHLLSNVSSIWFKITRNINEGSDSWRSGINS